jgi:hypothetical protein
MALIDLIINLKMPKNSIEYHPYYGLTFVLFSLKTVVYQIRTDSIDIKGKQITLYR